MRFTCEGSRNSPRARFGQQSQAIEGRDVAGGAIGPLAGLGWCKADDQPAAAVPERGHEIGLKMRRAKFGMKLRVYVRIGMRGEIGGGQIEGEFARRVGRRTLARRLAEDRNGNKEKDCEAPQHLPLA